MNIYGDIDIPHVMEKFDEIPLTHYQCVKFIKLYNMDNITHMYRAKRFKDVYADSPLFVYYRAPLTIFMERPKGNKLFKYYLKIDRNQPTDLEFVEGDKPKPKRLPKSKSKK